MTLTPAILILAHVAVAASVALAVYFAFLIPSAVARMSRANARRRCNRITRGALKL